MGPTMYLVLGVSSDASADDLAAAYEARMAALDRELEASTTDAARTSVHDAKERVEQAWEVLSDARLRMQYDLMLAMEDPPEPAGPAAGPVPGSLHHDQPTALPVDPAAPAPTHHLPPPPPLPPSAVPTMNAPAFTRPLRSDECQLCGSSPAATITLRRETGMLLVRQSHVLEGRYCRSCGLSLFREMTNKTLVRGWWGFISFFLNWFAIARNLASRVTIGRLAEPTHQTGAQVPMPRPLDPGKPLYRRVGPLVVLALIVGVVLLITIDGTSSDDASTDEAVGTCVTLSEDQMQIEGAVTCDGSQDAVVSGAVDLDESCPVGQLRFEDDQGALCLTLS